MRDKLLFLLGVIAGLFFGPMSSSLCGDLVTDLNATVSHTVSFVGDHSLSVAPNYDATDETFDPGSFDFTTDPATLWNWEIAGTTFGNGSIMEVTLALDDNLDGEVRWGTMSTGDTLTFGLTGTATWDGIPGGSATWSMPDSQTLTMTNLAGFTSVFGSINNPTWTGDADTLIMTHDNTLINPGIVQGFGAQATFVSVPEPSPLLFCGLASLAWWAKRRRKTNG